MDLVQEKCVPCRGGEPALGLEQIKEYLTEAPGWELVKRDGVGAGQGRLVDAQD